MTKDKNLFNKSGIYRIACLLTGKFYIGSSVNIGHRFNCHTSKLRSSEHHNEYLQKSWTKYGENNFVFDVIEFVDDVDILLHVEERWIKNLYSANPKFGYNLTDSCVNPRLNKKHKQESKDKVSKANKGRKFSDESRLRMSIAQKGKKISPESIAKTVATKRATGGFLMSEHTKQKLREANTGRTPWNKGLFGTLNPVFGRKQSEEVKKRLSENAKGKNWGQGLALRRPIVGLNDIGEEVRFESTAEAQRQGYTNISRAIKLSQKVKGYSFKFDTND